MPFPPLLGNNRITAAFGAGRRALGAPVLLEGPPGSGRRTAAFNIAAGLLCNGGESSGHSRPCAVCHSCAMMMAGTHPDCHVLEHEGKAIKVEQVRELRAHTFIKPQYAETKVFIILEADRLSEQCQNALLKVLEEPQNCVFLLTCEDSAAMLQTVRSRCVAYRMEPLPADVLARELSGTGTEREIATAIEGSCGFLGRARALLSGSEVKWQSLARAFAQSLKQGELAIYSAAANAGALSREEYPLFLNSLCDELSARAAGGDASCVGIYEYICSQREILPHNPGVAALSSALAAYCGRVVSPERRGAI